MKKTLKLLSDVQLQTMFQDISKIIETNRAKHREYTSLMGILRMIRHEMMARENGAKEVSSDWRNQAKNCGGND